MDPVLVDRLGRVEGLDARAYEAAVQARTRLWHVMRRFFDRHDVLVTPTTAVAAFPLTWDFPPEIAGRRLESQLDWYPFTYPFNLTGHPAVSVPCGWTPDGLPIGLQIVGPRFAEPVVLRVAATLEAIRPWRDRRPSPVPTPAGVIPSPLCSRG
jgi:aspartyl-tRNA(Asn)/glutamyl-tRNA(Gln) amidotransferase subunit A